MTAIEHERRVLEAAMTTCRHELVMARDTKDELRVDLLEGDLNGMLERWERLAPATEATEATHA